MPAIVTFDPINLRIVEINTGLDTNSITWQEIYSEWKEWVAIGTNAGHAKAFEEVGGNPTNPALGKSLGVTLFLLNGWRFRPAEYDHRVIISGNLYTDPAGFSPHVATLGGFTVLVETEVSNLTDINTVSLESEINTLATAIAAVDTKVTTVDGKVDTIDGNVDTIGTNVTTIDGKVDAVPLATAIATLDRALSGHTTPGTLGDVVSRLLKVAINRMELAPGATGNHVIYDDDDVTPLYTFNSTDKDGNATVLPVGMPARRSKGS